MSLPKRPMSERQQMKLLRQQQLDEEAAARAAAAASQGEQLPAKRSGRKKKPSLQERKEMARQEAKTNRKGRQELSSSSPSEEEAEAKEQTQDDDDHEAVGDDDAASSSEAELAGDPPPSKKKKNAAATSKKRRRIIDDDEDEESSRNEDGADDEEEKPATKRFKRVVVRQRRTRQTATTLVDSSESDDEQVSQDDASPAKNDSDDTSKIPKKGSIPRKQARADEIPRKDAIPRKKGEIPRRKLGDAAESMKGGDAKPSSSSLLQNMTPGNPAFQTASMNATSAALLSKSLMQPNAPVNKPPWNPSGEAARTRNPQQQPTSTASSQLTSPGDAGWVGGMTPPPQPIAIAGAGQALAPPQAPFTQPLPSQPTVISQIEKENNVLQAIGSMCDSLNKDNRFQIRSATAIDMSGSFLSEDRYDFFDVDSHGDIVLQAKIPIFPEDFPPGKTEWPLAWWGIVDPALSPAPKTIEVEETTGAEEHTVAIEIWPTRSTKPSQHPQPQAPLDKQQPSHFAQTGPPAIMASYPPPPSHFQPSDAGGRGDLGRGGGGRGGPWAQRGGGPWSRGGRGPMRNVPPPVMHSVPPPNYPPNGPRGRGMRPGDRPPPSGQDNWRPPSGHRY